MTVGLANGVVPSGLGRGNRVTGVFDRSGLEQHLPVILPGIGSECGGNKEDVGFFQREMTEEFWKANVVANGQSQVTKIR